MSIHGFVKIFHIKKKNIWYHFYQTKIVWSFSGGGVLHSKLLVADRKHFYLGSANLSDRGLTKTKEMGILVTNCPELADDAAKLFDVYWELGGLQNVPKKWPTTFR